MSDVRRSWISWPLAYLMKDAADTSELSLRHVEKYSANFYFIFSLKQYFTSFFFLTTGLKLCIYMEYSKLSLHRVFLLIERNNFRFRHLDTMVRLKASGTGSRRGSSNGCSPDPSPSASPSRGRSPNGRA